MFTIIRKLGVNVVVSLATTLAVEFALSKMRKNKSVSRLKRTERSDDEVPITVEKVKKNENS